MTYSIYSSVTRRVACDVFFLLTLAAASSLSAAEYVPNVVWRTNAHAPFPWQSLGKGSINSVKFSSEGNLLISGGADRLVKLWDAHNGAAVRTLTGHVHSVLALAVSPDGTLLASGGRQGNLRPSSIKLWSLPGGELVRDIFSDETNEGFGNGYDPVANAYALDFSPDGTLLAACDASSYGTVPIWRLSDLSVHWVFAAFGEFPCYCVAFSPDGLELATSSGAIQNIRIRNVVDRSNPRSLPVPYGGGTPLVAYSRSPDLLAVASEWGPVGLLNPVTGITRHGLMGHTREVTSLVFTRNDRVLVSSSADGSIRFWRVANGKLLGAFDAGAEVNSLAASRDGRFYAFGQSDGMLVLAKMPTFITGVSREASQTIIEWEGPGGPYQLQQCTNLSADVWRNVGEPTSGNSATNSTTAPVFYRVQDLGNQ